MTELQFMREKIPYTPSARKHFEVSSDRYSRERIKTALAIYRYFEREAPGLVSLTVWGSLAKGKVLNQETAISADVDFTVYLDIDGVVAYLCAEHDEAHHEGGFWGKWIHVYRAFREEQKAAAHLMKETLHHDEKELERRRRYWNERVEPLHKQHEALVAEIDQRVPDTVDVSEEAAALHRQAQKRLRIFRKTHKKTLEEREMVFNSLEWMQKKIEDLRRELAKEEDPAEKRARVVRLFGKTVMKKVREMWKKNQKETLFFVERHEKTDSSWRARHEEPIYLCRDGRNSLYQKLYALYEHMQSGDPRNQAYAIDVAAFFSLDVGGGMKRYRHALFRALDEDGDPSEQEGMWNFIKECVQFCRYPSPHEEEQFIRDFPQGYQEAKRYYCVKDL